MQGRLVAGPPDRAGHDLLTNLAGFASQPVQPPLDRNALLGDLVQEVADPAAINQHAANTCALAVGQMYLAEVDPAEYLRLQAGLASPAGPAILMQALAGRNAERVRPGREGQPTREAAMARLEAAVAERPQQVNARFGPPSDEFTHALLVQRMDADHVYYRNPWGTEERMSRSQFQERVNNLFVQDAQATRFA